MSKDRKRILAVFIVLVLTLSTMSVFAFNTYQPGFDESAKAKIDENIPLEEGGVHEVLVKVKWHPDLEPILFNHDAVIAELKSEAARTQEPILQYLSEKPDAKVLNTFWLTNLILVEADASTIRELATFTDVIKIMPNFNVTIQAGEMKPIEDIGTSQAEATWNIAKVRAPEVWEMLGITGEGVKFATTDTGLDLTHPELQGTLFTADPDDPTYPGGWVEFDSAGNPVWSTPHDTYGHGTATYGLIVGDAKNPDIGAVGMARGAAGLGMHALTLPGGGGTFAQVEAGLQWVIDPYDKYGNHYPPAKVSSHSWGATGYRCELIEAIENMRAAGHFVVFSIGNTGEGYSDSPGNYYSVVGAGATDINDYVASFSSGEWVYRTDFPCDLPDYWPDQWIKPDVSAPGLNVIVPYPGNQYVYWSGTSFSAPHVAGAAILMLSGNPSLTPAEIEEALEETAVWYDYYYDERPDTRYGWGRIDALEAVMMVALPQGIKGYVTDAETGEPVADVEVYAHEADRRVFTDETGFYDLRLTPGTYTLTFSRFGYYDLTVENVTVEPDVFTWLDVSIQPVTPGYIEGTVYFEPTGIGIPGATVSVLDVPITIEDETDATGFYHISIPPGTYSLEASAIGFSSDLVENVTVEEGLTTTVDFYLTQPPKVAVIGDYGNRITDLLEDEGYPVDQYPDVPSILDYIPQYATIVFNRPTVYTYYSDFMDFIDITDANGVGVVWLDSWASYTGGYWLWLWYDWPPYRYTGYSTSIEYLYYRVLQTDDDIIPGFAVGDKIIHDQPPSYWHDHAYYMGVVDGDIPGVGTVKTLTNVGRKYPWGEYDYYNSQGIIKVNRTDNKWVVLSMHANTPWIDASMWTEDSKQVFLNSINWVARPMVPHAKFVVFDLNVEPEVGLWYDERTVSVGIKNVGWEAGTHTVEMFVDGTLEGVEEVTLSPGDYVYLSWTVSRFEVGTYRVTVEYLEDYFIVRAPIISLKAYEFNKNKPLAGAEVYGYYRKYTGPGYFEQWSYAYGGYGHSQHAQPVGDIDEDGINEIIVGGYEAYPDWGRARILSYNAALETYIEEYSWYVPGGYYHSPSGSTVLDLDEDGDLEFVVSWTYSGADGVYAYDWDGETLTELDYYPAAFVFDVYSGDYDDDGDIEVLVANAPWGGTPYHVIALGWQDGGFVVEATWRYGYYTWEAPMLWSGDTDNDGKTEVIVCISYSYYYTLGTWALNWNPTTGEWEEELVYDALINGGTHYGVVVGDVDGDGTPEIGIGNNRAGYVGAGAVLIEWDGTQYTKVWEGSWPGDYVVIEALAVGDADNDGQNEFLAGGGDVHVIGWTGTHYTEEATIPETEGLLSGTIVADTDTDGLNEVKATSIIVGPGKEWIFKYTAEPLPLPGWYFEYFGTTDQNGELCFDAPESVVDMFLFVYKPDKTPLGWQYLLTKYEHFWTDTSVTYEPTSETDAVIISRPNARALSMFPHVGVTWLQYDYLPIIWPFTAYRTDPATIVVSPQLYIFYHMLNIIDPFGSWWYYFMSPDRMAVVNAGDTYEYSYGGSIQGFVEHTQIDDQVIINWDARDNFGHQITGIALEEVSWLTAGTLDYVPVPIKPSFYDDVTIQVGETINYYPLITLYDKKKNILASGYVQWYEKPAQIMLEKNVEFAVLSFVAGPYYNPNAKMSVYVVKEG
jgi:hypothetical protein